MLSDVAKENPPINILRGLPSVEKLSASEALQDLPRNVVIRVARSVIAETRNRLLESPESGKVPEMELLVEWVRHMVERETLPTLRPAINATGVVLHTNLGRATLAASVASTVQQIAVGHASLEIDDETGGRGSRQAHVTPLLCQLTGTEDAFVVNNNAAATFLAIAALAAGREVILSRGQLVEIGGHFRLPEVIESAGAKLVEVGTTNRTRINDYSRAINERTAMLLRVHPSNYKIVGFTEEATIEELVQLGREKGVPVGDDIGSGALVDFAPFGLMDEPMAAVSIAAGADIVWFSGDKLLGGPQSGILIGKKEFVSPLKQHPLSRALRPDKMTLSALEMTLRIYCSGNPWQELPALRRIARPASDILAACGRVARGLREASSLYEIDIVATSSEIGGGSLPGNSLSSWAVAVDGPDLKSLTQALRQANPPVYGRIERQRLLFDLRTVEPEEEVLILESYRSVVAG